MNSLLCSFISEWFEYAHSSIDAVGLRDFPRFSFDEHPLFTTASQVAAAKKANKINEQTKWEVISNTLFLWHYWPINKMSKTTKQRKYFICQVCKYCAMQPRKTVSSLAFKGCGRKLWNIFQLNLFNTNRDTLMI